MSMDVMGDEKKGSSGTIVVEVREVRKLGSYGRKGVLEFGSSVMEVREVMEFCYGSNRGILFWKLRRSQRKFEEEKLREAETIRKREGRDTEDDKERKSKDGWAVGVFFVGVGIVYFVLEVMEVSLRKSWSIRS